MVSVIVTVALVVMMNFNLSMQEKLLLEGNELDLTKITQTVSQALQTMMLDGNADIAVKFERRLENIEDIKELYILRADGSKAFADNKTIDRVNEVLEQEEFIPREEENVTFILPSTNLQLQKTVATLQETHYYIDDGQTLVYLLPVGNQEDCQKCHGSDHAVRGVIYISSSLIPVYDEIKKMKMNYLGLLVITLLVIILITSIVIRRVIVQPIKIVTDAMFSASKGDLSSQVPVLSSDEIGVMAASFNLMIKKLLISYNGMESEQHKLATIILSTREGIIATNAEGDVVLVNPAAEQLLGKTAETIRIGGLVNIVNDQDIIKKNLLSNTTSEVKVEGRIINLYASIIKNEAGRELGSAVLLREITHEKELEDNLRRLAITDELTGLFNRRHLDEMLAEEIARATRYHLPLSILFFDIDHFKKFNDQHGHDQGDRVLEGVASMCKKVMRDTDKCCRYGGEEFLVILPATGLPESKSTAERLLVAIENMLVDGLKITISIGVAEFPHNRPVSSEKFVIIADKVLYQAKNEGRNRVVCADNNNI